MYSHLPFPTFLTSCLAVLARRIQLRLFLEWAHARPLFHSAQASERPVYLIRRLLSCSLRTARIVSRDFFTFPVPEPGDRFTPELLRHSSPADTGAAPCRDASAILSLLANTLILHTVIIANQAKPHVPVDRVLNLHNGRDMAGQLAHGAQQCCCFHWRHRNTARSRMECTRHSHLFRMHQCAQEHPCFYALTTQLFFPYSRPYSRLQM